VIRTISSLIKVASEQGSKVDAKDPFISDRTSIDVRTRENNANFTFVQYRANIFLAGGTEIFDNILVKSEPCYVAKPA